MGVCLTCDIPTIFCNPEKFVGYHYIDELILLSHDNNTSEYMKDHIF